jgi:hypothetical protein
VFDAVIFLYPEYAKEKTLQFLEQYTNKGGKLMIEGTATKDYLANNIAERWKKIAAKATATKFDVNNLAQLGISKNNFNNSILMADGSWLFSDYKNFTTRTATSFSQTIDGNVYAGKYCGYAALQCNNKSIQKFAATALQALSVNGKTIFALDKPADVSISKGKKGYEITIAGKDVKVLVNELK